MIIASNPIGGLGNQLFQIFATLAYGMKYGRRIVFTISPKYINDCVGTISSKYINDCVGTI